MSLIDIPIHAAPSETALQSGGAALPAQTRRFYEQRLGYDLSGVRVHTGPRSRAHCAWFGARAFTYGRHIWLGHGERVGANDTVAHELVHVLQQQQLPAPRIQRKQLKFRLNNLFWLPKKYANNPGSAGVFAHARILPAFQATIGNLLIEVAIPGAMRRRSRAGTVGFADLYRGLDSTKKLRTIGLMFLASGQARPLQGPRVKKQHGLAAGYSHTQDARPKVSRGRPNRLQEGPVDIKVGDLKPAPTGNKVKAGQARLQLGAYRQGIVATHAAANRWAARIRKRGRSKPQNWPPLINQTSAAFRLTGLKAPPVVGPVMDLVIHQRIIEGGVAANGRWFQRSKLVHAPAQTVSGRMHVVESPAKNGVYLYYWHPDSKISLRQLPRAVRALDTQLTKHLVTPLRTFKKVQPLPAAKPVAPLLRSPRRVALSRAKRDHFNAQVWKQEHARYMQEAATPAAKTGLEETKLPEMATAIDKDFTPLGARVSTSPATRRLVNKVRHVRFFSRKRAAVFGRLRGSLGRVLNKIVDSMAGFRRKFKNVLPPAGRRASSIPGAIVRVGLKIARFVATRLFTQTLARAGSLLFGCAKTRLDEWFSFKQPDALVQLQAKLANFQDVVQAKIDRITGLLDPFFTTIKQLGSVVNKLGTVMTIIKYVRWAVRVAMCAAPPLLGCLWNLLSSAVEYAIARLLDSAWFMRKMQGFVIRHIGFLSRIPDNLARMLLQGGGKLIGGPVGNFLLECVMPPRSGVSAEFARVFGRNGPRGIREGSKAFTDAARLSTRFEALSKAKRGVIEAFVKRQHGNRWKQTASLSIDRLLRMAESMTVEQLRRALTPAPSTRSGSSFGTSSTYPGVRSGIQRGTRPPWMPHFGPHLYGTGQDTTDPHGPKPRYDIGLQWIF